ncbi:bacterial extracellular solute-binding proteins, family 5 Middle [Longilinea arvoryzae]|uniref:Bacterial extracellular solute-binding proteins, family 5 Middle n=1 Tax=Longilinea arvoryzae TaxID=360412 RepID=A0A0S7B8T5_9CHLR|nr:ABC transporter substrate-binding protein [Longilinea arvoryzae]GAP13662.1 bacterial extracellular solute-binding proteins, family 5 Middle [Longilinea arvoryzae]
MKTTVKYFQPLLVLGLIFVLLTGCQSQTTASPAESALPTSQKMATVPASSTIAPESTSGQELISADLLLDPALAQDADSLKICQDLYEGLVRLDANGKPAAGLAESWVISDDQLDYIFTLRTGMTFSDGTPITPDVVVANFNRWFDPQNALHKGDFSAWKTVFLGFLGEKDSNDLPISPVDGIQKVDQDTVLVHLNRPMPEMLASLAQPAFAILNSDALAGGTYGSKESTIISSGLYVVKAWTDEGLQLGPNAKYWGEAPQAELNFGWNK